MAAITNVQVAPKTGPLQPIVTFAQAGQDQLGEIRAPTANGNIAQGDPTKLIDGNTYRISYVSVGNTYNVTKKYEAEYNNSDAIFVND